MNRYAGFTLMEMVIAIAIFGIIATVGYGSLIRFLDHGEILARHDERLRQLQLGFGLLERDIRYLVNRPVRNEYGDEEAALISNSYSPPVPGELLRLTTSAPDTLLGGLSRLQRVAWRLEDGKLYRVTWPVLDRAGASKEAARMVLADVATVELRLLRSPEKGQLEPVVLDPNEGPAIPDAIEILLTDTGNRVYRRLIEVAGAQG
jgi:general secretion pathway protein J